MPGVCTVGTSLLSKPSLWFVMLREEGKSVIWGNPGMKGWEFQGCAELQAVSAPLMLICVSSPSFSLWIPWEGKQGTLCATAKQTPQKFWFFFFIFFFPLPELAWGMGKVLASSVEETARRGWHGWSGSSKIWEKLLVSHSKRSLRVAAASPRLCQRFHSLFPAGSMMANQIYLYKMIMMNNCNQNYLLHGMRAEIVIMVWDLGHSKVILEQLN